MALTDTEIKTLLRQAKQFERSDDHNALTKALEIYDMVIEAAPEPFYYADRSRLRYRLNGNKTDLIDGAIADISKAIELDPDQGDYYRLRGDYQLYKISKISPPYNVQSLMPLIEDYRSCISKSPTQAEAWLSLIAVNIMTEDFDEAISLYGQCAFYSDDSVDKLGRSLLGCVALIMAGDKVEDEDLGILGSSGSELKFITPYITGIIPYLNYVKETNDRKWSEISRVVELYIRHYSSWRVRIAMLERVKLREPVGAAPAEKASANAKGKPEKKGRWVLVAVLILAFLGFMRMISDNTEYQPANTYKPFYSYKPNYTFDFSDLEIPTYYPVLSPPAYATAPPLPSDLQDFFKSIESSPAETAGRELEIISVTSPVAPDGYATLVARGKPGVEYDISVIYYSGPSKARGLVPKAADEEGNVSWRWHVGPGTRAGEWKIVISGGGEEETTYFTVTG